MKCLHCGDCCIRFAIPELDKPAGVRCKYLTDDNLCELWDKEERPKVCNDHDYPASICPIGLAKLELTLVSKKEGLKQTRLLNIF